MTDKPTEPLSGAVRVGLAGRCPRCEGLMIALQAEGRLGGGAS
jgi:uncharacterized protein (DUF983 family)